MAGVPVERMTFRVPHAGRRLGARISTLSYNGFPTLAVIAGAHLVPDPRAIADGVNRELAAMLKAVRRRAANSAIVRRPGRKASPAVRPLQRR
ncbi:MAG: WS/DGAT domain-containing protein [Casimicrobiaceae bacterium]